MAHDLAATTHDLTLTLAYNSASQIVSVVRSNDLYAWTGSANGTISTTADGLNRIAGWNGTLSYDARGNVASDGTNDFAFNSENLLTSLTVPPWGTATINYDPLMRFAESGGSRFLRFEDQLVAEYYNGALVGRFVPGEGLDEIPARLNSSGVRTWYYADERGSTIAVAGDSGAASAIHAYDEYGRPNASGAPRIGYAGQAMLSFNQLYDNRNRLYHAGLGRFLQTDPIGYEGGINLYAYVGGDPVNFVDPLGWNGCGMPDVEGGPIFICAGGAEGGGVAGGDASGTQCGRPRPQAGFQRSACGQGANRVTRTIRRLGAKLDRLAEKLKPPAGRREGESFEDCVSRIAGDIPALAVVGFANVGAGGAFLGYPRTPLAGGGGGTSLISSAARGSFGGAKMSPGMFGTGSIGGAVGRLLSSVSVVTGAAVIGWSAGKSVGAVERCQ